MAAAGVGALVPDYRLAPEHPFPATGDLILPDARLLVDRAIEHGVDARLELYAADTHVFHVFWSFLPEAADALRQAGAFVRAHLAEPAAGERSAG